MPKRSGFTLLEILLVIVLIGILASVVVLNFDGDTAEEQVDKEAVRFQQVFQFIAETAQLRQQEWGLVVAENGYAFVYFADGSWQWVQQPEVAKQHRLPEGLQLQLEIEGLPGAEQNLLSQLEWQQEEQTSLSTEEGAAKPPLPQVFILSSGEISPFRLSFSASKVLPPVSVQVGTDFSLPLSRFSTEDR
ncbi:type II secretion system minor pseudopilin GspH [Alishewanella sp. d11]|uniref:type II secretion system minor pseudopilin GspH n=1 Tax=Alishewanella sp. d11 TaxID=3414030 RepID=UPI003BF9075E